MANSSGKVAKAGAGYVVGNYLIKGLTFLSAPIFTRLLTTAEFGDFGTYSSFEGILYILVGLALHSSLNNAKYKYKDDLERYVSSITTLIICSTAVWLVLGNTVLFFFAVKLDLDRVTVNVLVLHSMASAILQVFNAYCSLNYSYKRYVTLSSIYAVANMGFSALLCLTLFTENRYLGRVLGAAVPMIGIAVYIFIFFFKKEKPNVNKEYWKYSLVYSLPIVPHGISQIILSTFDRIMIKYLVGSAEAGIYSFAFTIESLIKVAVTSLENVWKPWMYEKMEEKDYAAIRKGGTNYVVGIGFFTSLVMLATPELIIIFGSEAYWDSTKCVVPVVVGGFFAFMYSLPSLLEYYYEKTKFIAIGSICAALINIVLNALFIPKYGYIAAAYTTLVTYILYFVFHYILARIVHGSYMFSSMMLILAAVGVIGFGLVTMLLEKQRIIRWVIIVVTGIIALVWGEKTYKIKSLVVSKLKKK